MNLVNWRNATPEQKNLWDYVKGLIAYTTITPLFFQGAIAGSEFLTYNAGKLYIALDMAVTSGLTAAAADGYVTLYNELNATTNNFYNKTVHWDATAAAARYTHNSIYLNNLFFSRVLFVSYTTFQFNGYRLNV